MSETKSDSGNRTVPRRTLRSAAQAVIASNRLNKRRFSVKGVPLLNTAALSASSRSLQSGPTDEAFRLASRLVQDSLDGREFGDLSAMLEKTVHHTISRILRSMTYKVILCSVILLQAVLIIWEHNPPFDSLPFSWKWGALEMFCIAVYVTDIVLLTVAFGWRHFKDKKWDSVFALLTFMAVLDWFLYYAGGLHEVFRFSRPFRPILLISKLPGLRRLAASIFHTFFVIFDIAVLFAITVAFFGLLGVALFNDDHVDGYALDNDNFNNFPDAALAIYILTTTENFPDVMMPALHDRPVLGLLFFVVALFIFLWLLLPLLLAIVYDRYKDSNQRRLRASRVKQYVPLVVAFQHLNGGDGNGTIDLGTFSQLMMHLPEKRTSEEVAVLFEMLDTRGEGELTIEDFLALPRALRMRVQIMEENRRGSLTAGQPDLVHQVPHNFARETCCEDVRSLASFCCVCCGLGWLCCWSSRSSKRVPVARRSSGLQTKRQPLLSAQQPPASILLTPPRKGMLICRGGCAWFVSSAAFRWYTRLMVWGASVSSFLWSRDSQYDYLRCRENGWHPDCELSAARLCDWLAIGFLIGQLVEIFARILATGKPGNPTPGSVRGAASIVGAPNLCAFLYAIPRWTSIRRRCLKGCERCDCSCSACSGNAWPLFFSWLRSSRWNVFDLLIVIVSTVSTFILLLNPDRGVYDPFRDGLEALRALHVLRVVSTSPRLRTLVDTAAMVLFPTLQFGAIYLSITYVFAVCGMALFGDVPNHAGPLDQQYTFSTFPQAVLQLFQLTVGNNWNSVMYPNLEDKSRWLSLYFVAYFICCTTVVVNIITSVVLDAHELVQEKLTAATEANKGPESPPLDQPSLGSATPLDVPIVSRRQRAATDSASGLGFAASPSISAALASITNRPPTLSRERTLPARAHYVSPLPSIAANKKGSDNSDSNTSSDSDSSSEESSSAHGATGTPDHEQCFLGSSPATPPRARMLANRPGGEISMKKLSRRSSLSAGPVRPKSGAISPTASSATSASGASIASPSDTIVRSLSASKARPKENATISGSVPVVGPLMGTPRTIVGSPSPGAGTSVGSGRHLSNRQFRQRVLDEVQDAAVGEMLSPDELELLTKAMDSSEKRLLKQSQKQERKPTKLSGEAKPRLPPSPAKGKARDGK